jgi:hypothetical protein
MEKSNRTYSQVLKREIQKWIEEEKILKHIFTIALIYSLVSNIVSKCCPIECSAEIANIGNAIDELLKNICYSVLAGIIFYVINDVYKNLVKRISETDKMFYELLRLQTSANSTLYMLSGIKYNKSMHREQTYQSIMAYLFNEDVDYQTIGEVTKIRLLRLEDCVAIITKWKDLMKMQEDLVAVYGDLLERDEVSRLNYLNDNMVLRIIDSLDMQVANNENCEYVQISDYGITIIINRIIFYKEFLTKLAKKYVNYSYRIVYQNRILTMEDIE